MRGWRSVFGVALLGLAITGCKPQKTRRPRNPPPPVAQEEEPAPPPPTKAAPQQVPEPPPRAPHFRRSTLGPRPAPRAEDKGARCGPGKGPRFAVQGVAASDTLNVRAEPDARSDVLGELPPDATGVMAVGEQRKVGPSTWRKVKCGALVGWVNERFLDPQGDNKPATASKRM